MSRVTRKCIFWIPKAFSTRVSPDQPMHPCWLLVKQSVKYVRSAELENGDVFQSSIRSYLNWLIADRLCPALKTNFQDSNIAKVTDTLEESSSKILKAVKVKEEHTAIVSALHREIKQRDERINELLKLKKFEEGESSSLLNSVKIFILEQQSKNEQKIQKLLDNIQDQIKLTKELVNSNKYGFEENNKHFIDVKYANARHVEDVEKRLLDELVSVRVGFDRQRQDLETFFKHQILPAQQKHLHAFEQHVQKSMTEGLSQVPDKADEMILERHSELKAFHKSQQRDLEKYIKSQSTEQSNKMIKQSQELYSKQQKIFHKEINQTLETFTNEQKQVTDENKNYLNELKKFVSDKDYYRPWQNENVPKLIQDKLDELHSYHQSEIKRLETEIENQKKINKMVRRGANTRSDAEDAVNNSLQNVYNLQQNCIEPIESSTKRNHGSMFKTGPGLLSPRPLQGIFLNSRTLFGRTNPSPIAKVLPQRKQDTIVTEKNAVQATKAYKHSNDTHTQTGLLKNKCKENEHIQRTTTGRQKSVRFSADTCVGSGLSSKTTVQISNTALHSANLKKQQTKKHGRKNRGKKHRPRSNICLNPGNTQLNMKVQSNQRNIDRCQIVRKGPKKNSINYERRQAENSMTSPEGKEISDISQASMICSDIFSPRNIVEFHDELSPGPTLRKQNQTSVGTGQTLGINETRGKWLAASDSASGNSDGNSSPPLSVTDIFISTAMEDKRRSAKENDIQYRPAVLSDFQCTPNLNELFTDMEEQYVSANCKRDFQDVRPLRRIAEKRKLCD